MQKRWSVAARPLWALVAVPALIAAGMATMASAAPARPTTTHPGAEMVRPASAFKIAPNPTSNMMDCNGYSKKYTSVVSNHRMLCTDPHGPLAPSTQWPPPAGTSGSSGSSVTFSHGVYTRFMDNGHYVGHDEPTVKFLSGAPKSGNTMTYFMKVPQDPKKAPTSTGTVTKYAELSVAPWFGLPICDPNSYPQNPCTPDSDINAGTINDPAAAGSAFMELQFYPPGFTPFVDNTSCSPTKWCSALTIDSLESQFNFVNINFNCEEPVNFAYLQTNGTPTGPPSPQLANTKSFTPNAHTLKINPGDVLKVAITDPQQVNGGGAASGGITATVTDMTTHQVGWMTASANNGFMNTNYQTCNGSPFSFHAEYATASQQNQVPWAALEGGVLMEQEIGHGEACAKVTHKDPYTVPGAPGSPAAISDTKVYDTCVGGMEGTHWSKRLHRRVNNIGEGSCSSSAPYNCTNPTTQGRKGPTACPNRSLLSGDLCEFADGFCFAQGTRTVYYNGAPAVVSKTPVSYCGQNRVQNGDLDFDGTSYRSNTWPNGTSNTPTSIRYVGPFTVNNYPYPYVQFETDAAGSQFLCNVATGVGCRVPPTGAKFYPFWTITNKQPIASGLFKKGACVWNFGNVIANVTTKTFGKARQYGVPDLGRYAGTVISTPRLNPEVTGSCPFIR